MDRGRLLGSLLAVGAAFSYGVTVLVGRTLARAHLPPATALGLRFAIAGLALVALLAVLRRPLLPVPGERVRVVLFGAVGYAVESSLFYSALARGTAAAVTLLFYSYPAIVTLAEMAVTRQRPPRPVIVALALSAGGAGLIAAASGDVRITTTGVVLAVTAAASFALYLMLSDRLLVRTEALATGAWTALGAAASLITFSSLRGQLRVPFHRWDQLAVYGLATGAAFALMFAALRRVGSQRTSVLLTLEAVSAIALAAVFLGESIGAVEGLGGAAVLVAAVVISLTPTRPPIGAASEAP